MEERWARLIHPDGTTLELLPPFAADAATRLFWVERLKPHVLPGTMISVVAGHVPMTCQDVPFLSAREQKDSGERLARAESGAVDVHAAVTLLEDSRADGGHVLWVAMQPVEELTAWLAVLQALEAEPVFAVPMAFLLGRTLSVLAPDAVDRLLVTLEAEGGRILFFRGKGLVFTRTFRLPEGVDPAHPAEEDQEILAEALGEELNRVLQFVKQKHRGLELKAIHILGLTAFDARHREALERTLRLKLEMLDEPLLPMVLRALGVERNRRGAFNLLPDAVLEARRNRWLRAAAWGAAAATLLLGIGLWAVLDATVRAKQRELDAAVLQRDQRRVRAAERDKVLRERFPAIRVRLAEGEASRSAEALERLALRLLDAPPGIQLAAVEVLKDPAGWRFRVTGSALSETRFSVGPLATYMDGLRQEAGLQLSPMREVSISDRRMVEGQERLDQRAVTRFVLEGLAP